MEKAQILDSKYSNLHLQGQPLFFCKYLAEYIDYVSDEYREIYKSQIDEYDHWNQNIEKIERQILSELEEAKDYLKSVLKKHEIDAKELKRFQTFSFSQSSTLFEEFDSYLNGRSTGSTFRSDKLQQFLSDVSTNLALLGHEKDVSRYLVSGAEYSNYYRRINGRDSLKIIGNKYGNFLFSNSLPIRAEFVFKFNRERTIKPWGSFIELDNFKKAFEIVSRNENPHLVLREDVVEYNKIRVRDYIKTAELAQDIELLVNNAQEWSTPALKESRKSEVNSLDINELKRHAEIVHSCIVTLPIKHELIFDETLSILKLNGKEIKISKKAESDPHDLLKTLFKDKTRTWNTDEILDDWKTSHDKERVAKNKVYQAGKSLNRIIAENTEIKDFLKPLTTKTVGINNKYLESL